MDFDFSPYFKKYEALVEQIDQIVEKVKAAYPACVNCKKGCTDCCYALFDLSLVEALYLNQKARDAFGADSEIMEKANKADRAVFKLKKQASRELMEDRSNEVEILHKMGRERIRCPLLNEREMCSLYAFRPITCRVYGIPTLIQGMSHTCGKSGFTEGEKYPVVNMDKLFDQLNRISAEIVEAIQTPYKKMDGLLVPVSMAILTDYNDEYFGFSDEKEDEKDKAEKKDQT